MKVARSVGKQREAGDMLLFRAVEYDGKEALSKLPYVLTFQSRNDTGDAPVNRIVQLVCGVNGKEEENTDDRNLKPPSR